ncbi:MAG: acyltransferase [Desulfobacterales bacterium]|nr:acyltransferase [Desulfobacterales bacterium]MDJ0885416.1 acyltransferase [Desulfobacterales bacterium]MDJ0885818.1 acyltransferase [Desulfobacterales bacterium]MDJ0991529.1 acyltransferase [Desulfobacterales bacterium]
MRKDHRPYSVKKLHLRLQKFYVRRFLRPQFERLGRGGHVMRPWYVELFGAPIELGRFATVIACRDAPVRLCVWPALEGNGAIRIGDYSLICPGVRISSAVGVTIGHSVMMAHGVYLTDADWHDLYDRTAPGRSAPIVIEDNVWLGDGAIVCKGVNIGENSVVGAGAVVVEDIPPNTVAAGNPARVVKQLDAERPMTTRREWFADPLRLKRDLETWDRALLEGNTLAGWMRYLLHPTRND